MSEDTDGNLNEDQIESAKVIQSSGTSLLNLIDEILDLSKIESGKMELDYQDVKLDDVIHDLQNLFLPLVKDKSLSFHIITESNSTDIIETDRLRLDQVLRNLLSNAIKFTQEGSITLAIFEGKEDDEQVIFEVKDTGIGIAEEKQKLYLKHFSKRMVLLGENLEGQG